MMNMKQKYTGFLLNSLVELTNLTYLEKSNTLTTEKIVT